jgi:hypothetical protein
MLFGCDFPLLDDVNVYVIEEHQLVEHYRSGESVPFSTRPIEYNGLIFPVIAQEGLLTEIYLRVKNQRQQYQVLKKP